MKKLILMTKNGCKNMFLDLVIITVFKKNKKLITLIVMKKKGRTEIRRLTARAV